MIKYKIEKTTCNDMIYKIYHKYSHQTDFEFRCIIKIKKVYQLSQLYLFYLGDSKYIYISHKTEIKFLCDDEIVGMFVNEFNKIYFKDVNNLYYIFKPNYGNYYEYDILKINLLDGYNTTDPYEFYQKASQMTWDINDKNIPYFYSGIKSAYKIYEYSDERDYFTLYYDHNYDEEDSNILANSVVALLWDEMANCFDVYLEYVDGSIVELKWNEYDESKKYNITYEKYKKIMKDYNEFFQVKKMKLYR